MPTIRNEVDLISNAVTVDWQPRSPPPHSIRDELSFHNSDLPHFLHEITHWQCFQSVVGSAFRTLWDALVAATKNSTAQKGLIRDRSIPPELDRLLQNFKLGWTVYEPLIEGVALFAQWDATPGDAASCSQGALHLHELLLIPQIIETRGALSLGAVELSNLTWQRLRSELVNGRMGAASQTLKIDLLSEALSGPNGHYPLGYLFIKRLYSDAISCNSLFTDTDFFLAFVCACFFQDPVAGQLLFNLDGKAVDWMEKVSEAQYRR